MQTRHHRAQRDIQNLRNILVREPLHIGVVHHHAEILRQLVQSLTNLRIRQGAQRLRLGRTQTHRIMLTGLSQLPILHRLTLRLLRLTLTLTVQIDVCIRQDAVQPRLQVRTLGELVVRSKSLHVGFLHQVFSIGRVAAHPQGGSVELIHILHSVRGKAFA